MFRLYEAIFRYLFEGVPLHCSFYFYFHISLLLLLPTYADVNVLIYSTVNTRFWE
jgi:hypothetical protein